MASESYTVKQFMADAKALLGGDAPLEDVKASLGERLSVLSRRDDLTSYAAQMGPTDASNATYLLWREPPHFTLVLIKLDEHFRSPVHEHGDHWVVACGYRGSDRWDVYERTDGRTGPGDCSVELVDQVVLNPGDPIAMPPPPRAIHSHNNLWNGDTLELIFSAAKPIPAAERMIYDVPGSTCQPSWFEVGDQLRGDHFPPRSGGGDLGGPQSGPRGGRA